MVSKKSKPWIEKYRPKCIEEISLVGNIGKILSKAIDSCKIPHLLFHGPPGSGKTSTVIAIAKHLYGPDLINNRVMELNASDDRGIAVVRERIKHFASTTVRVDPIFQKHVTHKLLILDEADNMTTDAQHALRRTIETFSKITRFCFVCNYVSRIIEPIVSRCVKFHFKPLPLNIMTDRIINICTNENINLHSFTIQTLCKVSNGDLRKAITIFQTAVHFSATSPTSETVIEVAGVLPIEKITNIWSACRSGRFEAVYNVVFDVISEGYHVQQILLQLLEIILEENNLCDSKFAKISKNLAITEMALIERADELIQLLNVSLAIMRIMNNEEFEDD
jgi:replication factor C subunit 2/4